MQATPTTPASSKEYFEFECRGRAVAEAPAKALDLEVTRESFRFALASSKRFWLLLLGLLATPLPGHVVTWIKQLIALF
jgi:hypothetical protein